MKHCRVAGGLARRSAAILPAATVLSLVAACLVAAGSTTAAELRLKRECRAAGSLVTLGDVAEVFAQSATETAALRSIELFPAPTPSGERFLRLRELEDLLLLRGMDLSDHRFSGSSQVAIRSEQAESAEATSVRRQPALGSAALRLARQRLADAIVARLQAATPQADPSAWLVDVEPSPEQAHWLARPEAVVAAADTIRAVAETPDVASATSYVAPAAEGRRKFQVTVHAAEQSVRFAVEAVVSLALEEVVSVASLPRGAIIQQADVVLAHVPPLATKTDRGEPLVRLEDVVGKETIRAIPKGKTLTADLIRDPLLVRRGDVVTVCARAGGVCVRTMARARGDGSQGELVAVESLSDRTTYYTRVVRPREVEVYARARTASENPLAQNPATIRR